MKKTYLLLLALITLFSDLNAQISDAVVNPFPIPSLGTSFVRMPSRSGSQEIDAIYFNPAGVLSLREGFHLKVENLYQNIDQNQNAFGYKTLNTPRQDYALKVAQPLFPLFWIAYRKKKWAASFFVTPALGGGGATAVQNLPFAEFPIADFTALAKGIIEFSVDDKHGTNYSDINYDYNFQFDGLSYTPTFQFNLGYQVHKNLAISAGARLLYSITTAKGGVTDLAFVNESMGLRMAPGDYVRYMVEKEQVGDPVIGNTLSYIMDALPLSPDINARQSDIGFTPIIGLNFNWNKRWFIGMKYEHRTKLELTTSVRDGRDGSGAYVEGKKVRSDMPGVFAAGVTFKPNDRLTLAIGHRLIFYKSADLDGREELFVSNYKEFDAAFEYKVHPRLKISSGLTYRTVRQQPEFWNSVDYLLPAVTGGIGLQTDFSERISVELGFLYSKYITQRFAQQEEIFGGLAPLVIGAELPDFINEPFKRKVEYEMKGRALIASVGVNFWMGSIEENRKGRKARIHNIRLERKANLERRIERRDCRKHAAKRWNKRQDRKRSEIRLERRNRRIEKFEDIEGDYVPDKL